ncbi:hypothetical protein B7R21_11670 [Subtercola boreus]|uniref:Uncharacterized protein n=1 Tax=Subtercola boreus TaxID=120213 RepID=A0A3E0VQS4_9MICO|nr:hypothetical protein [Subtercola boreus]RFA11985.1 hypothetical protein B7R21_11670 [Subtercola boreus]
MTAAAEYTATFEELRQAAGVVHGGPERRSQHLRVDGSLIGRTAGGTWTVFRDRSSSQWVPRTEEQIAEYVAANA